MNILLTNDDGIDAPGLAALREAVTNLGEGGRVVTVAPAGAMSECGHRVETSGPIRIDRRGDDEVAVDGSPADCVRVALRGDVIPGFTPDWVFSGINRGGNLGVDVYYSGTVAAAREAAILGVRSVAISHYIVKDLGISWPAATRRARRQLESLLEEPLEIGAFWNVNLPHLPTGAPEPESVRCERGTRPMPVRFETEDNSFRYAGVYAERDFEPGSDIDHCFSGRIAVAKLRV